MLQVIKFEEKVTSCSLGGSWAWVVTPWRRIAKVVCVCVCRSMLLSRLAVVRCVAPCTRPPHPTCLATRSYRSWSGSTPSPMSQRPARHRAMSASRRKSRSPRGRGRRRRSLRTTAPAALRAFAVCTLHFQPCTFICKHFPVQQQHFQAE